MITTPRELLIAFPHQFPGGRPPLVARGWFRWSPACAPPSTRSSGRSRRRRRSAGCASTSSGGSLRAWWEADGLAPKERERIDVLIRAAQESSTVKCIRCGQPGQLHAHMEYVLPVCPEHARTHDAGVWMAITWLGPNQRFDNDLRRGIRHR